MALVEIIRLIIVLALTAAGYQQGTNLSRMATNLAPESARLLASVLGAGVGYVAGGVFGRMLLSGIGVIERRVDKVSGGEMVTGAIGLLVGALIALFVSAPVLILVPNRLISFPVAGVVVVILAYAGVRVAIRKRFEVLAEMGLQSPRTFRSSVERTATGPRVLDTSAIIDGRVVDVAKSGFLSGHLICPAFVLSELQGIADSSDATRRGRGRRGLQVLEELQGLPNIGLEVTDEKLPEMLAVDDKLVEYAKRVGGALVTTDFNLHKTAELQGVPVLNVNNLAASLRPVVVPGERLTVRVLREGSQPEQGVGYLEDGTMVVVEGASGLIGTDVEASVTSALQTGAGRMIFSTLISSEPPRAVTAE